MMTIVSGMLYISVTISVLSCLHTYN